MTGPLYFDATGVWATTVTQLVVSPTEHIPDLLTGPDGEPWILSRPSPSTKTSFGPLEEWAQEMLELSAADRNNTLGSPPAQLGADAEQAALPEGLLSSSPPGAADAPDMANAFIDMLTAPPPAPVLAAPLAAAEILDVAADVAPTVTGAAVVVQEAVTFTPWRSDRLAKKAKAQQALAAKKTATKDQPVERAQGVLMAKWGIMEDAETSKEGQRKKYMQMYEGSMPAVAIAAVDDLLSEGISKPGPAGRSADAAAA